MHGYSYLQLLLHKITFFIRGINTAQDSTWIYISGPLVEVALLLTVPVASLQT